MSTIADLPVWPEAYPNESRKSWLDAARRASGLNANLWEHWVGGSVEEPEKSRLSGDLEWLGFPVLLGDVTRIPIAWRVRAQYRRLICPSCKISELSCTRFPTKANWLDCRNFICETHHLVLQEFQCDPTSELTDEMLISAQMARDWKNSVDGSPDANLKRDLAQLFYRNWHPYPDVPACAELAWELAHEYNLSKTVPVLPPSLPTRIGSLPAACRIAALLLAFRAYKALIADPAFRPPVPQSAVNWFRNRWPAIRISFLDSIYDKRGSR